jgi:hypothetical protein
MSDPIKRYRRPDQQWKCGLQDKGVLCTTGPDHLHRCSNPDTDQTCHPRRTLIWWRRYLPVAFAAITVAILITTANMPTHREIIAPGPLTLAHAQLISNPQDPHRCSACHTDDPSSNASPNSSSTNASASSNGHSNSPTSDQRISQVSEAVLAKHSQSDRCISCHSRDMPHLATRIAHDLPVDVLDEMTAWVKQRAKGTPSTSMTVVLVSAPAAANNNLQSQPEPMALATGVDPATASQLAPKTIGYSASKTTSSSNNASQDLACSTCHLEHQGPHHDLQAIASSRCQACHQESFKSFANGHPQFENYPAPKQSRIAFDHRKHQDSHFTKTSTAFDCRSCHVDTNSRSNVGQVFRSLSFETACAKCHDASIKSSVSEGAIVFQVPSIDVEGLAKNNASVPKLPSEQWPEEASLMLDGKIPPLMQWLLMGELEGSLALSGLDLSGDLSKLRLDSQADRKSLVSLATASRMILEKIGNSGQSAFAQRFVSSDGGSVAPFDYGIRAILRGAPPDLFRTAFETWFDSSKQVGKQWKLLKPGSHLSDGGWMIDKNRLSISYIPTGHADSWLASVLESASDSIEADRNLSDSNREPNETRKVFIAKQLLSAQSVGRCTECHQRIAQTNSTITPISLQARDQDRWRSKRVSTAMRSLTKFDHGPHLIQPQLQSCIACHAMTGERPTLPMNPLHSEFASIKIEQCASCHHPQAAGDNCTQCHNYHASQR